MACGEQALKQLPHPMQRSGIMDGNSVLTSTLMAFTGQILTQE
jgi:hypothetical protein